MFENKRIPWLSVGRLLALICLLAAVSGCQNVEYYERERLSSTLMQLADSPSEVHFWQKSLYSREGSVGGIGTSAGGGCGCY